MPGRKSRSKGNRRELEARGLLPGSRKISGMYKQGPDIEWLNRDVEVKARAEGFKELHKWLEGAQILMLKADRREWLIVMPVSEFFDILEEEKARPPN